MANPPSRTTRLYGPYRYHKLTTPTTLRLIKLRPSRGRNDALECDLVELEADKAETYQALSWCWGAEPRVSWSKDLLVHEKEHVSVFKLSTNLEVALKALRRNVTDGEVRRLWVDAICINQDDLNEKSAQIPLMAQIYPQAELVNIWLGEGNKRSTRALRFIKQNVLKLWEFDRLCRKDEKGEDMSEDWVAFMDLLDRDWFTRRWVVQEISLANPAKSLVQCGEETITWQEFSDAVSLFIEAESKSHRLSQVMKASPTHNNYQDFFGYIPASGAALLVNTTNNLFRRSKDGGREPISTLEHLVCTLSIFNASNPRDIIYGLLAIAKDTQADSVQAETPNEALERSPEVRQQLRVWAQAKRLAAKLAKDQGFAAHSYYVDYTLPVIDVYKDFIIFATRKAEPQRALDIICRPWAPPEVSGEETLPSWICTLKKAPYDIAWRANLGKRMDRKNGDPFVGTPDVAGRNYNAAGSKVITASKFRFRQGNGHIMFVEGFVFDEVKRGELMSPPSENATIPANWRSMMKSKDGASMEDDFWRTLVADRGPDGMNPPAFYPRACNEIFLTGTKDGPIDINGLINESNCTIIAEFLRRVMQVIPNRRMMMTRYTGKLGLFPSETRSGDLVCILYGCSVPVILRRVEKTEEDVEADRQHDFEENHRCVVVIQNAFRKRRAVKVARTVRRNAHLRAHVWYLIQTHMFGSTSFNVTVYLVTLALTAWLLTMDLIGWIFSTYTIIKSVSIMALETTLAEAMDHRASCAVVLCTPLGPLAIWLYKRLRSLCLARWARLKSRPINDILVGRADGFYYKLIGETYVHGIMNGEALGLYNEARTRTFSGTRNTMNGHAKNAASADSSTGLSTGFSSGFEADDPPRSLLRRLTDQIPMIRTETTEQPKGRGAKRKAKKAKHKREHAIREEDSSLPAVDFFKNVTFEIH